MLQRYSFYFDYQTNFKFLKRKRDKKSAHVTINGMRAIHSYLIIQVSQVRELIEVKEVITPYGRSGSEETIVFFRKT